MYADDGDPELVGRFPACRWSLYVGSDRASDRCRAESDDGILDQSATR